jgi:TfoX/Sxy family transcriptional regulator of competence genes
MAFDEGLAERIGSLLADDPRVSTKKMFGGIAFLLDGKMFVGIVKDDLMVRVGPERYAESLRQPHARPMDFTGRPMAGYVFVASDGTAEEAKLEGWVRVARAFAETLPDKKSPRTTGKRPKHASATKHGRKRDR